MTGQEAVALAVAQLRAAGVPGPERDARWLFAHIAGVARDRLTLTLPEEIDDPTTHSYTGAVTARVNRVPMSHLLGGRDFYARWFRVTADVLDPRPETEILVRAALETPFARVLDLGVGSGAILVTLLAEQPDARGVGIDISAEAVLIAGENAAAHHVADRITLPMSDWWEDCGGWYDLIVANPPYIRADEMPDLAPELQHEPRLALTDEGDGLGAYRAITAGLMDHLRPQGRVLLEVGPGQSEPVMAMLRGQGLRDIATRPDLDGRPRMVQATR